MWSAEAIARFQQERGLVTFDDDDEDEDDDVACEENLSLYLPTAEAARYCGYRSASSLRKAAHSRLIWPVGRVSTNGPNVWLVRDLWMLVRGQRPPERDGEGEFTRSGLSRVEDVYDPRRRARPMPVVPHVAPQPSKSPKAHPARVKPRPAQARIPAKAGLTTRQLAARMGWKLERLQRRLRKRAKKLKGSKEVAFFSGYVAERHSGGKWRLRSQRPS